jgi:hypothetical protein
MNVSSRDAQIIFILRLPQSLCAALGVAQGVAHPQ